MTKTVRYARLCGSKACLPSKALEIFSTTTCQVEGLVEYKASIKFNALYLLVA